jgi:hypothetical protein
MNANQPILVAVEDETFQRETHLPVKQQSTLLEMNLATPEEE